MTLQEIIIAGAAGGAAKEITQNVWQLGQKWIASYFRGHRHEAIAKAEENSAHWMNLIAQKVQRLEEDAQLNRALFDRALVEPDFGLLLQRALIGAAQTEDGTKREVLAELVSNRLTSESESLYAVAAQSAADVVTKCTPTQLKILAFAANFAKVKIIPEGRSFPTEESFEAFCRERFEERFSQLVNLPVGRLDTQHLEALSCFNFAWVDHGPKWELEFYLWRTEGGAYQGFLNEMQVMRFRLGPAVKKKWKQLRLGNYLLTTTGAMIGVLASDSIAGADSNSLAKWKAPDLVPLERSFGSFEESEEDSTS